MDANELNQLIEIDFLGVPVPIEDGNSRGSIDQPGSYQQHNVADANPSSCQQHSVGKFPDNLGFTTYIDANSSIYGTGVLAERESIPANIDSTILTHQESYDQDHSTDLRLSSYLKTPNNPAPPLVESPQITANSFQRNFSKSPERFLASDIANAYPTKTSNYQAPICPVVQSSCQQPSTAGPNPNAEINLKRKFADATRHPAAEKEKNEKKRMTDKAYRERCKKEQATRKEQLETISQEKDQLQNELNQTLHCLQNEHNQTVQTLQSQEEEMKNLWRMVHELQETVGKTTKRDFGGVKDAIGPVAKMPKKGNVIAKNRNRIADRTCPHVYTMGEVYAELEKIGLEEEDVRFNAYEFLNKNRTRVNKFFGVPHKDRKNYLIYMMRGT